MKFVWKYISKYDPEYLSRMSESLKVPPLIASILLHRNINSYETARNFFRPHFKQLHDPFLMKDMDKAVERIHKALIEGEKIFVYGDYDVDGVTSTAILYKAIRKLGGKVSFYIPERQKDGYGLSENGVRQIKQKGGNLIITVDCGITAVEESRLINNLGMEMIICDHHQPGPELPPAVAILDPKIEGCEYPFRELAGCGVAFKLTQALYQRLGEPFHKLIDLLELVAVGTSADIVPLLDENRVLVKFGLEKINTQPGIALQALLEVSRMQYREITPNQIVFFLAPRINAVGRMGDASKAVYMFISDDYNYAQKIARMLEVDNRARRSIDEETFREAVELIEEKEKILLNNGLVLYKEGWHQGVIGIVASRVVEKYNRPTVLLSVNDGIAKGSARSIPGVDIYGALQKCSHLIKEFGGHKYAAGITIESDKLPEFTRCFNEAVKTDYPEIEKQSLEIEKEIELSEIDAAILRYLKMMKPYGPSNMRPLFSSSGVKVKGKIKILAERHLKFKISQNGIVIDAIYFNSADFLEEIESRRNSLNIAYSVEENTWNGTTTVQLRIRDFD
jgi:single-stranded-DNA-specific exonuclease